jgi:iron complex outermembrane receptor protein
MYSYLQILRHKLSLLTLSAVCFALAMLAPQSVFSQTATTDSVEEGSQLEEIIVHARKRAENLQEVPLSITAFSAADIESAGFRDVTDVAAMTPGFNMAPLFGGEAATPVIRGLSTTIGEPNVGFFVDGVYLGSRLTMTRLLGSFIERIEIARGPQSALYGRNTFGGAVNYVTKQPSEAFEGEAEVSVGSDGVLVTRASLGGPLGDSGWSYRLGALYDTFDGFYTNELTGGDLDDREDLAFLGALMWNSDDVDITLNLTHDSADNGDLPLRYLPNNSFFASFRGLPPAFQMYTGTVPSYTSGYAVTPGGLDLDQTFGSLNINWDLGSATFSSITGYDDFTYERAADDDYTAQELHYITTDTDHTEWSQEFRFTSTTDGPVQWMAGVFGYSLDEGIDLNSAYVGPWFPILGGVNTVTDQETTDWAIFGSLNWDVTETVAMTFEARYGNEEKKVTATDTNLRTGGQAVFQDKDDWSSFLPKFTISWQASDDQMLYASYAYSKKSGGFNVVTATGAILPEERSYGPENSDNYELGLKSTWADGRVVTTLAGYYVDWSDQIVRAIGQTGALLNVNAGATTSKGIEFDLMAQVTDNLDIRAGTAYNKSQYDEYFFAVLAAIGMDPVLDGTTLQYAPEWTFNFSANYTQPISADWEWFGRLDWDYLDAQSIVQPGNAQTDQSNRLNLHTGLENENWVITAWVYNLLDNDATPTGAFTFDPGQVPRLFMGQATGVSAFNGLLTAPVLRSYGLTVKYRF